MPPAIKLMAHLVSPLSSVAGMDNLLCYYGDAHEYYQW